jgi:hypothetical protein
MFNSYVGLPGRVDVENRHGGPLGTFFIYLWMGLPHLKEGTLLSHGGAAHAIGLW